TGAPKGTGVGRLWVFYAGHGVAPPGGGADEAPIVVPSDVKDLGKYLVRPIGFSAFLRTMQIRPPAEQLYFIDACRGMVGSEDAITRTQTLHFDLGKLGTDPAAAQARQAVLYATTAGQLANEYKDKALFGANVVIGLGGKGPTLASDAATKQFVLTFDA